jgi:adenylate kinase family enzyme
LEQRADDRRETVESRLEVYQRKTAPLKEFYQSQCSLKVILAGGRSPEEVHNSLKQALSGR